MFDRFVRLAQAKKALRAGRFEEAVGLVDDPSVREHRRSAELRDQALRGLLARAERRREDGTLEAALADVEFVLDRMPGFDGARTLRDGLQRRQAEREGETNAWRRLCRDARRHVERGELAEAEALLEQVGSGVEPDQIRSLIAGRREAARRNAALVKDALGRGDDQAARDALLAMRSQDRGHVDLERLSARVAAALGKELAQRIAALISAGESGAALQEYERARAASPELASVPAVQKAVAAAASDAACELRKLLRVGDLDRAIGRLQSGDAAQRQAALVTLGVDANALVDVAALRDRGRFAAAAEALGPIAKRTKLEGLARLAKEFAARATESDAVMASARELAASGDLVGARAKLLELLEVVPMHEAARREMELVETGARDQLNRLDRARELAANGELREATSVVLALAVPGPQGDEARLILRDLQLRTDTVQKGIQQVKRDAHGRASGSRDGIAQCVRRLEELERMQRDEPELAVLKGALEAELEAMDVLDRANAAIDEEDCPAFTAELDRFAAARARMLASGRLEARYLETVDRAMAAVERAFSASRLSGAKALVDVLVGPMANLPIGARLRELEEKIASRMRAATESVEAGRRALESRDVMGAEDALRDARDRWVDGSDVRRLEAELATVRDCETRLQDVERLAGNSDVGAARQQLEAMGPTNQLFRTRIFDIKQGLARAQGLDHAFLLRVDEGGEFLVMRGDTVSIGNMRDGSADLPILANLAGRHARIRRSMSFHGGMQDVLEADQGDVFAGGTKRDRIKLGDGQAVRLGKSFEFGYRLPSKRSLSAMITLRGFVVAGTDRILLMKDRGRDGRILIGRSDDVHVRVADADAEVEVFASKDGQVRVRCAAGGTIDGKPFQGDEPVPAGAVVTCGKVTFVLQPWNK